ncbi:phosphatase PAP2 family protein [Streptomyces sp. NPDC088921]|uniref:phosphatase PAP2 family protein n=1 Tax=unclassified Streptomyces TaxID=2593676 RepID=UPI00343499F4
MIAQPASNGLCRRLADRPRPPADWIPHDEVADRPDSSSFPSGHTAAAVAFTAASTWPATGALRAVPTALVAVEGVQGAHRPSDVADGAAISLAAARPALAREPDGPADTRVGAHATVGPLEPAERADTAV